MCDVKNVEEQQKVWHNWKWVGTINGNSHPLQWFDRDWWNECKQALHNVGPHGMNTQGQLLSAGHNTGKCCHNVWVHWNSATCALEQHLADICPMSLSIGQTLASHTGFALLKISFEKCKPHKTQFQMTWDQFEFLAWLNNFHRTKIVHQWPQQTCGPMSTVQTHWPLTSGLWNLFEKTLAQLLGKEMRPRDTPQPNIQASTMWNLSFCCHHQSIGSIDVVKDQLLSQSQTPSGTHNQNSHVTFFFQSFCALSLHQKIFLAKNSHCQHENFYWGVPFLSMTFLVNIVLSRLQW